MAFGDLSTAAGLSTLNDFLADKSYITGYAPSQHDVIVIKSVGKAPVAATYPHAARWYKHITSYEPEFSSLPGDAEVDIITLGPSKAAVEAAEEDDDVDLFGSDDEEEDAEAAKLRDERIAAYNAKKAAKPKAAAKSIVTLDVKPWDDETDLDLLTKNVKNISLDGLVWGAHQLIPIGFGIKKLQINCVVEDEKVSIDELQELIAEDEDNVQSTDVAAMQKL